MQTRAQKNKTKADVPKKKFNPSPSFNLKAFNNTKNDKKIYNLKRKNKSISTKFTTKIENNAKRKSSSLSDRKSRSRDKSIESEKKFRKNNGKLKNIILNNNSLKKNLISNKIQKNGKNNKKDEKLEKEEEFDFFDEESDLEEEEEKINLVK